MARRKRSSQVVDLALKRLAGLKSINPNLDLGHGLTVAAYSKQLTATVGAIDNYNVMLSKIDDALNHIVDLENELNELNVRMLDAVAAAYGLDSSEYEMVGGTRTSDRKKPRKGNDESSSSDAA